MTDGRTDGQMMEVNNSARTLFSNNNAICLKYDPTDTIDFIEICEGY